jgi:hypothetical protein
LVSNCQRLVLFYNLVNKDCHMPHLAVLSDIHSNLPALQAVLEDIEQVRLDGFILAGDYTGCPQAVETIQLLRDLKGWMIQGNGEASLRRLRLGEAPTEWTTLRQFGLLRWDYARLSGDWIGCQVR